MKILIDLGANEGKFCLPRAKDFDYVFAFEPQFQLVENLRSKAPTNMLVIWGAAWDSSTILKLHLAKHWGPNYRGASTLLPGTKTDYEDNPETVIAYDFGQWLSDFLSDVTEAEITLKMDIEGAEYRVIQSLHKQAMLDRIQHFIIEWHDHMVDDPHTAKKLIEGRNVTLWH